MENQKKSGMRRGLSIGLVLILLFLALVPAGSARTLEVQGNSAEAWRLPFVRMGHTQVYDEVNNRLIVFGGWNGQQFFNDVWALNLATIGVDSWTKLNPANAWPGARGQHSAIYDKINDRMIVYGGHGLHYDYDDVWTLDLETPGAESWTQLQPGGEAIGPRRFHTAIWDPVYERQQMLVFGGSRGGALLNDVWSLDLTTPGAETWSNLAVTGSVPAARGQHTAIYDDENELMIVFGGVAVGGLRNDTWALDLTTMHWTQMSPGGTPPDARRGHTAVLNDGNDYMLVFGGLGASGFFNDLWKLDLTPGARQWMQLSPTDGPPAPRAWHSATFKRADSSMVILGGRGMDTLSGEMQWYLNIGGLEWQAINPTLPGWWGGGQAAQSVQSDGIPDVTLTIEDAAPGTRAHLLLNSEVWFVVKLQTTNAAYANDVDVTLDVVAPKFDVTQVGTRFKDADEVTNWTTPDNLGGGRYRLENVDLIEGSGGKLKIQVVFKATPKAVSGGTPITAVAEGPGWTSALESPATARIQNSPPAWIVTNRTQLFEQYDNTEVRNLLDEIYEVADGRSAVVLYADRYLPTLENWDNTAVNYTNETTANVQANALDAWLDSWPTYPTYLVLVGDDNILPRYRKADYDLRCSSGDCSEEVGGCWGEEAVCDDLVGNDFFWTDNPYGDVGGGTDWQWGDLEIAVGRIVGGSAADMQYLLENAALGPNPNEDQAIIASGDGVSSDCFDWWLSGPDNDAQNVLKIFMGYDVNETLIDSGPSKAQVVGEMQQGFTVAALGHHGEVTAWSTPDDGDHLWCYEVPDYDLQDRMKDNLPFFYFNACRVGLTYGSGWDDPTRPDGPQAYDDSLVYGLIHQGISGVVASGGLMYLLPANNEVCCGESLSNDFWVQARAYPDRSDPLGWALMQAKDRFSVVDDVGRKTVQEYTYFGLPWMRLPGHGGGLAEATVTPQTDATSALWSVPALSAVDGQAAPDATYVVTANVDASTYVLSTTVEGFDLIEVQGLSQRFASGQPVLPQATLELVLPLSATLSGLVFTPTQEIVLPDLDIPSALLNVGLSGDPTDAYTGTADGLYPVTATVESRMLDKYQLVRVHVVPVTYDATNDQATLYRSVDVALEYDSPQTLALTYFEPDELQYLLGETISVTAHLVNAGDGTETVTATLILQDSQGQIVGFQGSGAFDVPPGGTYDLELGWAGSLDGDTYLARLLIWQGGQVVVGAGSLVQVADGEISEVAVPELLKPGEETAFDLTFDNLGTGDTIALASLAIYDQDDALVAFLPVQAAVVVGGGSATLTAAWTPEQAGSYTASFMLTAGGQEYGPLSQTFDVAQRVYLPLVMRNN